MVITCASEKDRKFRVWGLYTVCAHAGKIERTAQCLGRKESLIRNERHQTELKNRLFTQMWQKHGLEGMVYALSSKSSCISSVKTRRDLGLRINQREWRYIPDGREAEQAARWPSEALVCWCHRAAKRQPLNRADQKTTQCVQAGSPNVHDKNHPGGFAN